MSGAPHVCPACAEVFNWGPDEGSSVVDRQGASWASCRENAHWKLHFHMLETHPEQLMRCGRRGESALGARERGDADYWYERDHHRVCSYCGSMHPDDFFAAIEAGSTLGPTDKSYKVYVDLPHPAPAGLRVVTSQNFKPENVEGWEETAPGRWSKKDKNGPILHAKFYFQHLDEAQQQRFIDLHNAKKMNLGMPGRFYVRPYFTTAATVAT